MTESEIFEKTTSVIAEILRIDKQSISPKSRIKEDLGSQSLDQVALLMALEDEFKEEISDEEAKTLITVQDTVSFIFRKLAEKGKNA